MRFPKLNCVFQPPFCIRTDTKHKTVTGIFVFTIRHIYFGVSQISAPSMDNRDTDDAVILAYVYKSRRIPEITRCRLSPFKSGPFSIKRIEIRNVF